MQTLEEVFRKYYDIPWTDIEWGRQMDTGMIDGRVGTEYSLHDGLCTSHWIESTSNELVATFDVFSIVTSLAERKQSGWDTGESMREEHHFIVNYWSIVSYMK